MLKESQKIYIVGAVIQAIATGIIIIIAQFNRTPSFNGLQAVGTQMMAVGLVFCIFISYLVTDVLARRRNPQNPQPTQTMLDWNFQIALIIVGLSILLAGFLIINTVSGLAS